MATLQPRWWIVAFLKNLHLFLYFINLRKKKKKKICHKCALLLFLSYFLAGRNLSECHTFITVCSRSMADSHYFKFGEGTLTFRHVQPPVYKHKIIRNKDIYSMSFLSVTELV